MKTCLTGIAPDDQKSEMTSSRPVMLGWASAQAHLSVWHRKVKGAARRIASTPFLAVSLGSLLLSVCYVHGYLGDSATPGTNVHYPLGWNGWFDQGNYVKSATSLAHGALVPERHWYPLGYPLAGALFVHWMPTQCFFVADLLCLLACLLGFVTFCDASGIGRTMSVLIFLLGTVASTSLRHVWIEPWNTTLSAALIWWLLALSARASSLTRDTVKYLVRIVGMGALSAAMIETRPTDALLVVVSFSAVLGSRSRARETVIAPMLAALAGGALLGLPYAVLYLSIYGWHPTPYMLLSNRIGFRATNLWWKSYLLLIDPRPWLPTGVGLLQRFPWLVASFAGMLSIPFLRSEQRAPFGLLSLLIATTWTLFFLYGDLQPSGLWLFQNIHYFKWTFPGLLLLGFIFVRNLAGPHRMVLSIIFSSVLLACMIQLRPKPAREQERAWVVQVPQAAPALLPTYFGSLILKAGPDNLVNTLDFRAMPDSEGFRIIAYYHAVTGPLSLISRVPGIESRAALSTVRWRISPHLGFPCWLPPYKCDVMGTPSLR